MRNRHQPSELPVCITNALADRRGEKIRHATESLAAMITEMHGVPCHITIGEDFAFALIIRELGGADDCEVSR
jgi:hypothetical protein